jgi:hypothetical protein
LFELERPVRPKLNYVDWTPRKCNPNRLSMALLLNVVISHCRGCSNS